MPDNARHVSRDAVESRSRFGRTRWLGLLVAAAIVTTFWWTRPTSSTESVQPISEAEHATAAASPAPNSAGMPAVSLALTAPTARAQATVTVPRGTAMVHLRLVGDLPAAVDLTAELTAADRDDVKRWPVDDAPPGDDGATRVVSVPPYAVPAGGYVLTLWAGDADIVQRYAFRVVP